MPWEQLQPTDQAVPEIWGGHAETATLDIIVFSKDRACQLDALLRSVRQFFDLPHRLHVLYTTSTAEFELGYDLLRGWHRGVQWVCDNGVFGQAMLQLMRDIGNGPGKYLMFLVDDMIFTRPLTAQGLMTSLDDDDDILAVSLRMGENITYCYVRDIATTPPDFSNGYRWAWKGASPGYWNYPMSLDGNIFRTSDFAELLPRLRFMNPNTLEATLSGHPLPRPDMLCEQHPCVINIAANRVQSVYRNRCGDTSAEFLNESFLAGLAMDVTSFTGRVYDSCHIEQDIPLIDDRRSREPSGTERFKRDGRRYYRIDLREIPTFVLNCKEDVKKRLFQQEQLTDLGLQFEFVPTLSVKPGWVGVALGHLKVLRLSRARVPFLVLEDDCVFNDRFQPVIEIPAETEALYLGSSIFGLEKPGEMSWGKANKVVWERYAPGYLRIFNMLARHAVLYLDEGFQATVIESQVEALTNRHQAHMGDIGLAKLQNRHLTLLLEHNVCRQLNRSATDKDLPVALPDNEINGPKTEGSRPDPTPVSGRKPGKGVGSCLVSHKHRFVYFQIGKNASSTLVAELRKPAYETEPMRVAELGEEELDSYFKFTFLRDPVTRLLSAYHEISFRGDVSDVSVTRKPFMDMDDNYERFQAFLGEVETAKWDVHVFDQAELINHIPMDFYGRVETLQDDLRFVLERLGLNDCPKLPHRRSREGRKNDYDYDRFNFKPDDLFAADIDRMLGLYHDDVDLIQACCPAPALVAGTGAPILSSQARARAIENEGPLSPIELFMQVNQSHERCLVYCLRDRGFYAEVSTIARAMIYCWAHNLRLLLDSRDSRWTHEQGWSDYFEPFCDRPEDVDRQSIVERIEFRHDGDKSDFMRLLGFMPEQLSFGKIHLEGFHEILSFFLAMIFRPIPDCQEVVDQMTASLNLPAEYDAVHLRRGDKVGDEDTFYPVQDYLDRLSPVPPGRTLFVMSDAWEAVQEVRDYLARTNSTVRVVTLAQPKRLGFDVWKLRRGEPFMSHGEDSPGDALHSGYVRDSTRELIAETLIAARAERFVSTWLSNVGRMIWYLHPNRANCVLMRPRDSSARLRGETPSLPPPSSYHWADGELRDEILQRRRRYVRTNAGFEKVVLYRLSNRDLVSELSGLARAMIYAFSRQRQLMLEPGCLEREEAPHWHDLVQPLVPEAENAKTAQIEERLSLDDDEARRTLLSHRPDRLSFGAVPLHGFQHIFGFFLQLLFWPAESRQAPLANLLGQLPLSAGDYDALCLGSEAEGQAPGENATLDACLSTLQPVSSDRPLCVIADDETFMAVGRRLAEMGSRTRCVSLGNAGPPGPLLQETRAMAQLTLGLRARHCAARRDLPLAQAIWLLHPRGDGCFLFDARGRTAGSGAPSRVFTRLQLRNGALEEFELPSDAACLPALQRLAANGGGAGRGELLQLPMANGQAALTFSSQDVEHVSFMPAFEADPRWEWLPPAAPAEQINAQGRARSAKVTPAKGHHPAMNLDEGHLGGYISSRHPASERTGCENGDPGTWNPALWDWLRETLGVESVLDLGCGEGHSTAYLASLGCRVLGIDGSIRAERDSMIPEHHLRHDFNDGPCVPVGDWDAVWCCEFVEHVEERFTHHFLATMACARKYVLITYAPPGQPGWHHVNCQRQEYWVEKLTRLGFRVDDELTRQAREIAAHGHFHRKGLVFVRADECPVRTQEPPADDDTGRPPAPDDHDPILPVNPMPICTIEGQEFHLFLDIFVHPDQERIVAVMPWYNEDWDPAEHGVDFERVELVYRGRRIRGTWIPHRLDSWEPCALLEFRDPMLERWLKGGQTISFRIEVGHHSRSYRLSTLPPPAFEVMMSLVIKNENRWVRHFLEYYLECLEVDHVLVYDNDSEDRQGLLNILKPYMAAGRVSYIPWDFRWRNIHAPRKMIAQPQQEAHSLNRFANARWIGFLDVDEFLRIPGRSLPEFLADYRFVNVDGLSFGLRWFQYDGVLDFDEIIDPPLTFRESHPSRLGRKRQKLLVSPQHVRFLRLHTLEEGGRELQVDDTDIYFHHYCQRPSRFKNKDHEASVADDYMLRFSERLSLDAGNHMGAPKPADIEGWIRHITHAIARAECGLSNLDEAALAVEGYCGTRTRHFYNNLCAIDGGRYLEIGSWKGASTVSAMMGNRLELTCIDDFRLFRGKREIFEANVGPFVGRNRLRLLAEDCFELDPSALGPFDIYLYDGGHTYRSHYQAIERYAGTLAPLAAVVIDDWNWERVRQGTLDALRDCALPVLYRKEILLPEVNDPVTEKHEPEQHGWWNGICIMLLGQPGTG